MSNVTVFYLEPKKPKIDFKKFILFNVEPDFQFRSVSQKEA